MRIASLTLKNFKRFTDLEIGNVPENAKLVLLVGSNGSGKSSIFDAFNFVSLETHNVRAEVAHYDRKDKAKPFRIEAQFHHGARITSTSGARTSTIGKTTSFFGRSSLRVVSNIQRVDDAAKHI